VSIYDLPIHSGFDKLWSYPFAEDDWGAMKNIANLALHEL
jgi:hypothetical protein